MENRKNLALHD